MSKVRISLIGIDGSGKSTHLTALQHEFCDGDLHCKYVNLRGEYFRFVSLPFLILCKLVGYEGKLIVDGREYPTRHPNFGRRKERINSVWSFLFLVDVCILALFRGYFSIRSDVILCDRCIIDSIVDLMASLRDDTIHRRSIGRFFLWLMKPDIVLLLDLNEEEALIRGQEIPGFYYLSLRRSLYQKIALDLKLPTIDSSKPFSVVHEEILTYTRGIL